MQRIAVSAAGAWLALAAAAAGQSITNGTWSVQLDPIGVLVAPPDDGLVTNFGPRVEFERGTVDWYAVSYREPSGRVGVVGAGAAPDYAQRTPLQPVSSRFGTDRATTLARAGALEIEQEFTFCDATQRLLVAITVRNLGATILRDVVYSREWRRDGIAGGTFPPDLDAVLPRNPGDVWRIAWPIRDLPPRSAWRAALSLVPPSDSSSGRIADDLPLRRYTGGSFPGGLDFGLSTGMSFGDYDHDGWIDVANPASAAIWRNLGGSDWALQVDLSALFPDGDFTRYGCAFADYDDDQLLDLADEPRGSCLVFLHALGDDQFEDVALDPQIVPDHMCGAFAETNSVADVDGDGFLDWFIPIYGPNVGGIDHRFLHNLGPDSAGTYSFEEIAAEIGLVNPTETGTVPEGVGFADFDFDGDVDLYACVAIYRNQATLGVPAFELQDSVATGLSFPFADEEGAGLFDYDMDGDIDLCLLHVDPGTGLRMYENRGDGTFKVQPKSLFDAARVGLPLGLSFEDWDNDGDIDLSSSEIFRRNQWIETAGDRHFTVATHSLDPHEIEEAQPSWGDFDRDGDVDTALSDWFDGGHLYENYTYDATTPAAEKRHLRVHVVRDSDRFDDGLETEFGAQVSAIPLDHPTDPYRRTKVISNSGGYLNQNEYTAHLALPVDPDPAPEKDVRFQLSVDFKGVASQGTWRVDRHVNPALGDLDLAQLSDREIVVFRSGRVQIDGCDFMPGAPIETLTTINGGLVLAGVDTAIPVPVAAPASDWFVGIEIDTMLAASPQRIEELILDGKLAAAVDCGGTLANVFAWDVTDPAAPVLLGGGLRSYAIRPRNDRNYDAIDLTLQPGRIYRLAARVQTLRATPFAGPRVDGVFTTTGGLSFQDVTPCSGAAIAAAAVDPTQLYLTVRFRGEPTGAWVDLGHSLVGTGSAPTLTMSGDLRPGSQVTAAIDGALADAPLLLVAGLTLTCLPFADGVLVPSIDAVLLLTADGDGHVDFTADVADDVAAGASFFAQALVLDPGASGGFAFTNAVGGTTPW